MAPKIGTEYDITEELQTITIPIGDEGVGQTLINDGTAEIFWRNKDVTLSTTDIEAADADVLVAAPLFFSRLGPDELTHQAGITIYAIRDTTTQADSVLRVAPGRLYQSGDVDLAQMSSAIGKTTDDVLADVTLEDSTARTGISLWKRAVNFLIGIRTALITTNDAVSIADKFDTTNKLEPLWAAGTGPGIGESAKLTAERLFSTHEGTSIADHFEDDSGGGAGTGLEPLHGPNGFGIGNSLEHVAKGGRANSVTPAFAEKSNPTAINAGSDIDGLPLAADVDYIKATVYAIKPVSGVTEPPIANVGAVWICGGAENITGGFKLEPGQSMALPDNCNLALFFLAVENANDGVSISYTV